MVYIVFIFLLITTQAYADRVCVRKADGIPIEYQSGDAPLGTLTENAVQAGYKKEDVEEKYISREEYMALMEEKIYKPEREAKKQKREQAENKIKQKLNLTDNDLQELKEALGVK